MERPNFLIASTLEDAKHAKYMFPSILISYHVMTPRNKAEENWTIGEYIWTPQAKELPPRIRWALRIRLKPCIDHLSEEKPFPGV